MAVIINHTVERETKKKKKADIDKHRFPKFRRDELSAPEGIKSYITEQPDNTTRRTDRNAVRNEIETQESPADTSKQKDDRKMRPVRQHLDQTAEHQQRVAVHPNV